jgi:dCTP deaminase
LENQPVRVAESRVNVTPFEPEWAGFVTLENSSATRYRPRFTPNEELCQILFFRSHEPCETNYANRKGKYQNQQGIVLPRL